MINMQKYCEILNGYVNYIFTDEDNEYLTYINSDLNIKEITDKQTIQGYDIQIRDFYDELHDVYFSYQDEMEYKNFQEMLLIYLEDIALENKRILKQNNEKINQLTLENKLLKNQLTEINNKIDSLAKLMVFLNN